MMAIFIIKGIIVKAKCLGIVYIQILGFMFLIALKNWKIKKNILYLLLNIKKQIYVRWPF
jgi:hypothetical protein